MILGQNRKGETVAEVENRTSTYGKLEVEISRLSWLVGFVLG
jgi:hypothetical protein